MKTIFYPILTAIAVLACTTCAIAADGVVTWQSLGNSIGDDGRPRYVQRFTVDSPEPFDALAFCIFKSAMSPVNPADTIEELLPGYYAVRSDRFRSARSGEPVVIDIVTDGAIQHHAFTPDGIHLVADGRPLAVKNDIRPAIDFPAQWRVDGWRDVMRYGDEAYAVNDSLRSSYRPTPYAGIPTPKSVRLTGAEFPAPDAIRFIRVNDPRIDYYKAEITPSGITVHTNMAKTSVVEADLRRRIAESRDGRDCIPGAVIEDWADYAYRGFMLDVSRNFVGKKDVMKVLDLMARYRLNTLHFHLGDDEGWRVEIAALPELTAVGSRRGYATSDTVPYLKQIYCGNGSYTDPTTANGYYTAADYIDLLRYADSLGIEVIPEFDTPGHSRAAIRAMEYRFRTTGDASYRLVHDGDTSVYSTAQCFHDDIMNPALDGPYRFWSTVIDAVKGLYAEAGVNLPAIHIGGDEVPAHAWDGSDCAQALMRECGYTHQNQLHAHFVRKVAEIAAKKGVKIAGWQEIAYGHSEDYNNAVCPQVAAVNCWTTAGAIGPEIARSGYPLVLSNVNHLYFDHVTTSHPEEPGMSWGGLVDEFAPLHATRDRLCPGDSATQANIVGVSAQLFSETVRSRVMIERYMLPRLLGLAERAHNSDATLTDNQYFGILTAEMSRWSADGTNFYLRQPGIRVNGEAIEMNEPYGVGEIRYTLDGSLPVADSPLYTKPISLSQLPDGDAQQVRARLFYGPAVSATSILYVK